jgi:hypothetical protein
MSAREEIMFLEAVICAYAITGANIQVLDVPIKFRSASEIMEKVHSFPHEQTMIVSVDRANLVRLIGPADECKKVQNVIDLFDIKPVRIKLVIHVQNLIRKTDFELEAKVKSSSMFMFSDDETGADISISPSFRNKNEIEFLHDYTYGSQSIRSNFSSKPNVESTYKIGPYLQATDGTKLKEQALTVKIKAIILP